MTNENFDKWGPYTSPQEALRGLASNIVNGMIELVNPEFLRKVAYHIDNLEIELVQAERNKNPRNLSEPGANMEPQK